MKLELIKSEAKQIYREPIMVLLFLIPLVIPLAFKLMILYLIPFLSQWVIIDIEAYRLYILAAVMAMNPAMLGVVMGFMMLDDKDGKIIELMSITPMTYAGYLKTRMFLLSLAVFVYSIYTYFFLSIWAIPLVSLLYISLLLCIYGVIIGLIFAFVATDKVKGLTYAKGLNVLMLFTLSPLLNLDWVNYLSSLIPTYWITMIIINPSFLNLSLGLFIHLLWLYLLLRSFLSHN